MFIKLCLNKIKKLFIYIRNQCIFRNFFIFPVREIFFFFFEKLYIIIRMDVWCIPNAQGLLNNFNNIEIITQLRNPEYIFYQ